MYLFLQLGHKHSLLCPERPELGADTAQELPWGVHPRPWVMPAQDFCCWCHSTSSNPGKRARAEETEPRDLSAQRSSLAASSTAIALRALAPGICQESAGLKQVNVSAAVEIWGMSWGCWVGLHFRNASAFG